MFQWAEILRPGVNSAYVLCNNQISFTRA